MRNLIVLIHGGSSLDVESAKVSRRTFAEFGFELKGISVNDPGTKNVLKRLIQQRGDDIAFFMSSNFWAINIRDGEALLHTLTGIPLVVLLHDHPVYFLPYLSPSLDGTIVFAPGDDGADFVKKHYPFRAKALPNPAFLPQADAANAPDFAQFVRRENVLLCPINLQLGGANIDQMWASVKSLPKARMERTTRLIDAALTDCVTPLHKISEQLTAAGDPEIQLEDLTLALNFIKLWRRTWLVRTIIELPVLITSSYVPADLEYKYPKKFKTFTIKQSWPLFKKYRFVVNSTPLLTGYMHDRVIESLIHNAVCVTDRNAILNEYFRDERDMLFIDYANASIASKLTAFIDSPERAFALTVNAYNVRRRFTHSRTNHEALLNAVAKLNEKRSTK